MVRKTNNSLQQASYNFLCNKHRQIRVECAEKRSRKRREHASCVSMISYITFSNEFQQSINSIDSLVYSVELELDALLSEFHCSCNKFDHKILPITHANHSSAYAMHHEDNLPISDWLRGNARLVHDQRHLAQALKCEFSSNLRGDLAPDRLTPVARRILPTPARYNKAQLKNSTAYMKPNMERILIGVGRILDKLCLKRIYRIDIQPLACTTNRVLHKYHTTWNLPFTNQSNQHSKHHQRLLTNSADYPVSAWLKGHAKHDLTPSSSLHGHDDTPPNFLLARFNTNCVSTDSRNFGNVDSVDPFTFADIVTWVVGPTPSFKGIKDNASTYATLHLLIMMLQSCPLFPESYKLPILPGSSVTVENILTITKLRHGNLFSLNSPEIQTHRIVGRVEVLLVANAKQIHQFAARIDTLEDSSLDITRLLDLVISYYVLSETHTVPLLSALFQSSPVPTKNTDFMCTKTPYVHSTCVSYYPIRLLNNTEPLNPHLRYRSCVTNNDAATTPTNTPAVSLIVPQFQCENDVAQLPESSIKFNISVTMEKL